MVPQTLFGKSQVAFRNGNFFRVLGDLVPKSLDIPNLFSFRKLTESTRHLYRCFRHVIDMIT